MHADHPRWKWPKSSCSVFSVQCSVLSVEFSYHTSDTTGFVSHAPSIFRLRRRRSDACVIPNLASCERMYQEEYAYAFAREWRLRLRDRARCRGWQEGPRCEMGVGRSGDLHTIAGSDGGARVVGRMPPGQIRLAVVGTVSTVSKWVREYAAVPPCSERKELP